MRVLASLLLVVTVISLPVSAHGQEVMLRYLPAGEVLTVRGVEYMAYTLDLFREVAEVDIRLQHAETEIGLLEEQLQLRLDQVTALGDSILLLEAQLADAESALVATRQQRDDALASLSSCSDDLEEAAAVRRERWYWHSIWTPIALGAVTVSVLSLAR